MKLSEAILLGSKIRPQGFEDYYDYAAGATCALGAAMEAIGIQPKDMCLEEIWIAWPTTIVMSNNRQTMPGVQTLMDEIEYRNDTLRQTREEIAAWLAREGY